MVRADLDKKMDEKGGLAEHQHGLRKRLSRIQPCKAQRTLLDVVQRDASTDDSGCT